MFEYLLISDIGSFGVEQQLGQNVHGHQLLQQLLRRVRDLHLVDLRILLVLLLILTHQLPPSSRSTCTSPSSATSSPTPSARIESTRGSGTSLTP